MIDVRLSDGTGGHIAAEVTSDAELSVITAPYPPFTEQKVQPFRQYLTDDGLSTGTFDMCVDGSVTNVDYCVLAHPSSDRYITTLNIAVGYGATAQPYQWADGAALANGTRLFYENRYGEADLHDALKANQDMFRLGVNAVTADWQLRGVGSHNDHGYYVTFDLTKLGPPFGVKLDAGSNQKLVATVRDNVGTATDIFNIIAYGFDRFE